MSRHVSLAALLAVGLGCGKVQPVQDANVSPADDADNTSIDAPVDVGIDAPSCGSGASCVNIPTDWTGPVTYAEASGSVAACSGNYPTEAFVGNQGFNAGAASCTCTCGAISLACGTVTGTGYAATNCTDPEGSFGMALNTCISVATSANTFPTTNSFNFDLSNATSSCGAPTTSSNIPTPTWANASRVCGGAVDAEPGVCANGGFCAPPATAPFGAMCVYKAGDNACPTDFPSKELVHQGFADTRSCTSCACNPSGATCTAVVRRYQNGTNNCAGSSTADVAVTQSGSGCINRGQDGIRTVSITANPLATCAKTGGTLTGTAAADQPMTVCCR